MRTLFLTKMDEFNGELQKTPSAAPTNAGLAQEFHNFKAFIMIALQALQGQVELLDRKMDNLEMHSRRKILLLHGLPEKNQEDTEAVVVKAVVEQLKLKDFTVTDISRCHRMGKSSSLDKPRPVLLKLCDMSIRSKIWFAKTELKGSGVTLSEFLTKSRHDTFMAARQKYGVSKCWTRDGFIHVIGPDGTRHRLTCMSELNKVDLQAKPAAVPKETVAPRSRRAVPGYKK